MRSYLSISNSFFLTPARSLTEKISRLCNSSISLIIAKIISFRYNVKLQKSKYLRIIKVFKFVLFETIYFLFRPVRKIRTKSRNTEDTRFVFVISFPRSGTTALGSILEQPRADLNYLGEFFALNHWNRRVYEVSKFYPFFAIRYLLGFLLQKIKWRPYLFERLNLKPDKALSALSKIPGTHVFKIFPTHIDDHALAAAIKDYRPDILFIRRNHLDRLVSHKKAKATGLWHGVSTDSVELEINEKELREYVTGYETFYQKFIQYAFSNSLKVMDVEYENLFKDTRISAVLSFILGDHEKVKKLYTIPRTHKQDSSDVSQRTFLREVLKDGLKRETTDFNFPRVERSINGE